MNYMDKILDLGSVNGTSTNSQVSVFHHQDCPFRLSDMRAPDCNTGCVYMLVSMKVPTYSYIGETKNIHACLNAHNSGNGANSTLPESLRPYALFAYVCGFEDNKTLRQNFEKTWKIRRDEERMRVLTSLKICSLIILNTC